ncbi:MULTISPECIES: ester cyclase [unclassified Leptolyngbya]|uniref:ester cyclase n=1 Tax=unclassified Leptolyngbya TaxID=2650499 RepID=UPI00168908FB|nr:MULTISPECIES: ester cyclase [unclassified Leptolyngbya]MBD1908982.1 ester cyclase [Leptolyngbya sp. FACHB-8]MBD2158127.1 ester cyclase [Leptolyngbya sp. FACHB-16]
MTPTEEQNLAIARIFIEQFLGKGDMTVAADVLDENVQAITGLKPDGPIDGREAYKQVFSAFFDAFPPLPGFEMIVEDMFAAGDRVAVRFRSVQKHAKEFFGVPATNRDITFIETHVMRLREGKLIKPLRMLRSTDTVVKATLLKG